MQRSDSGSRRMVSIGETAEYAGVTDRTVRNWISQGVIRGYRIGGRTVRIDLADVDAAFRPIPTSDVA